MAETIVELLTDVADAIREKKGTTEPINAQNFAEEIRTIESGETVVEKKDVSFYDYDGTLLFSYTIEEAQALTELPTPKGHEGLIFQGWNWDYEEVIALTYPMNICATYITEDGATRFFLDVQEEEGVDIELSFTQSKSNSVLVDFGDGSELATFEENAVNYIHHYSKGNYVLTFNNNGEITFKVIDSYRGVLGHRASKGVNCLTKVWFGKDVSTFDSIFQGASRLTKISIHKGVDITRGLCGFCANLKFVGVPKPINGIHTNFIHNSGVEIIVLPSTTTSFSSGACSYASLKEILLPDGNITLNSSGCFGNNRLVEFRIPFGKTTLENAFLSNERHLCKIAIPEGIQSIGNSAFTQCVLITEFVFPSSLQSIGSSTFSYCKPRVYDFSKVLVVPTLANANAFTNGLPYYCKIVVPDTLYDEWIAATNWSTYADYIVKSSEYTE